MTKALFHHAVPRPNQSRLKIAALVALLVSPAATAQDYEVPGSIPLAEAAPQALLKRSQGKIGDPVSNDGMLNTYTVTAPQGEFTTTSIHGLCKLVREVNAIQELAVVDKSDAFTEQAKESARNLGSTGKRLLKDPKKTLKNAAKGVGDIFRDLGERVDGDDEGSEVEDSSFKEAIGFARMKRKYAFDLGVDVYTNNQTLEDYLDQIAWAGYSGGMSVKIATSVATSGIAGAATSVTSTTATVEEIIRDTTPSELREWTRDALRKQGIEADLINLFIRNEELSPRQQVAITSSLAALKGVKGKQYLVRRAANARSYDEGFDRQVQTQMYLHIHSETPIRRFVDIGDDRVVAETTDGSLQLAATVDHLVWTESVDRLMQHKNQRIADQNLKGNRQLWLTGSVSERAAKGLADLGWGVRPDLIDDYLGTLCNPTVPKVSLTDK
jgi:hypothetical protein